MSKGVVDRYYDEINLANELRKAGKTRQALDAALRNLARVPDLVRETTRENERFALGSIPPIEIGCSLAAVLGDEPALDTIASIVEAHKALEPWREYVATGHEDLANIARIRRCIDQQPGCIQSTLGKAIGIDGRRASGLLYYLAQAGLVERVKQGRSYALYPAGAAPRASAAPVSTGTVRRTPRDEIGIHAAQRIGVSEEALRAKQAGLGRFDLADTYWRIANESALEIMRVGNLQQAGVIYREMARFLLAEGKRPVDLLKVAVRCEALFLQSEAHGSTELAIHGCRCPGCSVPPRSVPISVLGELGQSSRELPATIPLPHDSCASGLCPCRLEVVRGQEAATPHATSSGLFGRHKL